ncbi:MAG: hypothetical protein JWM46_377 [Candidatus Kaiserbacteria bacterium]|nr:hypothetical protein [Candidatus Kaiserbacteria bacterium]
MRSRSIAALTLSILALAPFTASAATTPAYGAAATYGILAGTYNNPVPGTTVNGDIGFITGPAVIPSGTHTNYGSGAPFTTAISDINTALTALNTQPCTFTFPAGAVDLSTDTLHGALGVYTPGVYCVPSISPSVTIGTAGITLSGSGTYIFRLNRSLVTASSSVVTLSSGASACDVFWTPVDNAITSTLGENSKFAGTIIGTTRLDIRTNVAVTGGVFLPSGIVSTNVDDTISAPASCVPVVPPVVPPVVVPPVVPPVVVPPVVPPVVVLPVVPPAVTTSIADPKTPNTGSGGHASENTLVLALSALLAVAGSAYILSRRSA